MHGRAWPDPARYQLTLDVGPLSTDGAAEAVVAFVRKAAEFGCMR
jgi:hypothetical protein